MAGEGGRPRREYLGRGGEGPVQRWKVGTERDVMRGEMIGLR